MIGDLGYAGVSKNDINNKDPWKANGYTQMDRIWTERIAGHFKYNVEIQDRQNGSLTWRVVYQTTGGGVTLGAIAGSATSEIEFNLLITA